MARYKPIKAKLVARDDTVSKKTPRDALDEWMSSMGVKSCDTSLYEEVLEIAKDKKANFYHMQHYLHLASVIPCVAAKADPLERIILIFNDVAVRQCAQRFIKQSYPILSHLQAKDKTESMIPVIDSVVGGIEESDPAAIIICIMAGKDAIESVAEELPFTPDIYELASRVKDSTQSYSSLYPSVAKDHQFTALDYKRSQNKYSIPKKTDFYDVGEKVSSTVGKEYMDVDEEASDLLMQGYNLKEVVRFHSQAPEGYWEAVSKIMDKEPDASFDSVYDRLESQFHFHPDDRNQLI